MQNPLQHIGRLSRPTNCTSAKGLLSGCLTSQQHSSVSQGRVCSDNFACCHTEIEVADQTFHLTQSQYTDTGPTSPSADPITPGAWRGSHWRANVEVTGTTRPQSCAIHVQRIERLSRTTCVTCHMVRRDSSAIKFDRVEIALFELYFIG